MNKDRDDWKEHEILWPPPPSCPYCGRTGREHVRVICDTCGKKICPPDSYRYRTFYHFCCEDCLESFKQAES
ncbi:MAG TPA: hypothetical protein PLV55_05975 [Anaerohalosphaeraceae bacterium]|nr:hypothetical protein [Anaerohalosphaeraceae bacterium]